jgi:hypothetical protein
VGIAPLRLVENLLQRPRMGSTWVARTNRALLCSLMRPREMGT